ncbi:hypothetical protein CLAIMM_10776 [Cladophialophora immunda]|nr:hypothetical protein CLAIMM_10776 [Cladophialophora immunda]
MCYNQYVYEKCDRCSCYHECIVQTRRCMRHKRTGLCLFFFNWKKPPPQELELNKSTTICQKHDIAWLHETLHTYLLHLHRESRKILLWHCERGWTSTNLHPRHLIQPQAHGKLEK